MSLEIIGFIATLLSGLFGIYVYYKKKYPCRIECFENNSVQLLNTIVDNFNDVTITYRNEPIKNQLRIHKYLIVNTGWRDISREMIKAPIKVVFPSYISILDVKLNSKNGSIRPQIKSIEQNQFEFDFDSLLINECIEIELLLHDNSFGKKISEVEKLKPHNGISFTHRILNTAKIKIKPFPQIKFSKGEKIQIPLFILIGMFLIGIALYLPQKRLENENPYKLQYSITDTDSSEVIVDLDISNNSWIHLFNDSLNFNVDVPIDSFFTNLNPNEIKVIYQAPVYKDLLFAKVILLVIGLLIVVATSKEVSNRFQYKKIFNQENF